MHDIKAIRDNPAAFDAGLKRRGLEPLSASLLALDAERREVLTRLQDAQSRRNAVSKDIGAAKKNKDDATATKLMAEVASLKDQMAADEAKSTEVEKKLNDALALIPNLPLAEVPDGKDEKDNKEVRRWGEARIARPSVAHPQPAAGPTLAKDAATFTPKQHFELGEALGLMDFEAAAKVSGARFVFLKGALARMERALVALMLDTHTAPASDSGGGYTEVNPPILVRDAAAYGTTNLPKFKDDLFETARRISNSEIENEQARVMSDHIAAVDAATDLRAKSVTPEVLQRLYAEFEARWAKVEADRQLFADGQTSDRFWLIPTAEVSLTNLAREQIIDEDKLPWRFTAATPCFRSEAGAAGRDTRGMIRQHQFTKVELVSITTPENALAEHERMTSAAQSILEKLKLPYRTVLLCTGDMGFASQKTYDIEVWLPGQDAYREISSCSVCGDIQSRRMDARYRAKADGKPRFVYTLNGSGLAVGRTLVAILENYQQADGSIVIPEALRSYMGGLDRITKS